MNHTSSIAESAANNAEFVTQPPASHLAWDNGRAIRRQIQNPFLDRFFRRMFPDQRKYPRLVLPPLLAYLGNPGSSRPFAIADVSVGGFCLRADEFWTPGTVLTITLESSNGLADEGLDSITVPAMVVRRVEGAAGFAIALASEQAVLFPGFCVQQASNIHEKMARFLERLTAPVAKPCAIVSAPAPAILTREQKLELLLESARHHRMSEGWEREDEDATEPLLLTSSCG